ncbi:MAG: DUF3352 domain-containing protein [Actinomycetota bacterium]
MKGKWIALIVCVVVLAAAGVYAYQRVWDRVPDDVAISITPENAGVFASLYVNPSNDQKRAIDSLLQRFPQTESFDDTKNLLINLLDPELEPLGINFEDDIEPWLGDQIAGFVVPPSSGQIVPDAAALLATDDEDATQEAIDKVLESQSETEVDLETRTHEGIEYRVDPDPAEDEPAAAYGFVESYLVVGTEGAVTAAIDASQGSTLEDSDEYRATVEPFYEDRIALVYFDAGGFLEVLAADPALDPRTSAQFESLREFDALGPYAFAVRAASDGAMIETSTRLAEEGAYSDITRAFEGQGLVRDLPGASWAALGLPQVGLLAELTIRSIEDSGGAADVAEVERAVRAETGLDLREDILSWMGNAGLFVQGTDLQSIGGGLVVESSDPAKSDAALDALVQLANREQPGLLEPLERDGRSGYSVQVPGLPVPINVLGGESLIVAVGEKATDDLLSGDTSLGDSERFDDVDELIGEDLNPIFFVDIEAALQLADNFLPQGGVGGAEDDVIQQEVRPVLEHFTYAVVGVKVEGGTALQRFVVGIE